MYLSAKKILLSFFLTLFAMNICADVGETWIVTEKAQIYKMGQRIWQNTNRAF